MTSITHDGQVEFRFFRRNVNGVSLVGTFNAWDPHSIAMKPQGDGWWTARLRFDADDYRFHYLADGQWFSDYASFGLEPTKTGYHSILRVPPATGEAKQHTVAKQVA